MSKAGGENESEIAWLAGALERLQRERDFSDAVINSLPGVLYLYDLSGRFLRWNHRFETVTEYSGEEISGMHPLDFFAGADAELVQARIADVFTLGESSVEAGFVSKTGRVTPYFLQHYQNQIAKTLAALLGLEYKNQKPVGEVIQSVLAAKKP